MLEFSRSCVFRGLIRLYCSSNKIAEFRPIRHILSKWFFSTLIAILTLQLASIRWLKLATLNFFKIRQQNKLWFIIRIEFISIIYGSSDYVLFKLYFVQPNMIFEISFNHDFSPKFWCLFSFALNLTNTDPIPYPHLQGVTIKPDDSWTEWCYSGHSGRFCQILGRVVL